MLWFVEVDPGVIVGLSFGSDSVVDAGVIVGLSLGSGPVVADVLLFVAGVVDRSCPSV